MKKTVISLLLVLTMGVGFVLPAVPRVQAAEHADHCVCGGKWTGDAAYHSCQTLTQWKPLDTGTLAMNSQLSTGNYYLTENVQLLSELRPEEGAVVTICLNGKKLMGSMLDSKTRVLTQAVASTVNICDCSAEETGTITTEMIDGTGGVIYQNHPECITNIYSGTIYGGSTTTAGGAIRQNMASGGVLNMYGGRITGGHSDSNGGNLAIYTCFNMYGGIIDGGTAGAKGGNLYIGGKRADAVTCLYGGAIYGGVGPYGEDIWLYKFVADDNRGKLVVVNTDTTINLLVEANLDGSSAGIVDMSNADSSLSLELGTDPAGPNQRVVKTGGAFVPPDDGASEGPVQSPTEGSQGTPVQETTGFPVIWVIIPALVVAVAGAGLVILKKKKV